MMKAIRKKRFAALALLALICMLFYNTSWWMKTVYPIHYRSEIKEAASRNGVDPLFVAAIIRVESNYRTNSESPKGAVGIMQIMPETAKWLFSIDKGLKQYNLEDLDEAEVNIRTGTRYLAYLEERFAGNRAVVSAAYNAGHGKVDRWLAQSIWDGSLEHVEQIPIMETRKYVQSVDYYYNKYSDLYSGEFPNRPSE